MIPTIFAHGIAGDADEFAVVLLGIALLVYMAAIWIGDRMNKESESTSSPEPTSAAPLPAPADDKINVE